MSNAVFDAMLEKKAIAIVRGIPVEKIVHVGQALLDGGINFIEVTYDHRSETGMAATLEGIRALCETFGDRLYAGAGTVMSAQEVRDAAAAGAKYIISPNVDEAVIRESKALDLISLPGAMTPSEIASAYAYGADIVKVFPATDLGPSYIKAVRGPLAHIPMAAVGGVGPENVAEFMKAGTCCFGFGGNLVSAKAVAADDYASITATAKAITEAIAQAK